MWIINGFKVCRLTVNRIVVIQTISMFAFMSLNDDYLPDKSTRINTYINRILGILMVDIQVLFFLSH